MEILKNRTRTGDYQYQVIETKPFDGVETDPALALESQNSICIDPRRFEKKKKFEKYTYDTPLEKVVEYMASRKDFDKEFEDSVEKIVAQMDFDIDPDDEELTPTQRAVLGMDEETKMDVLRHYNVILDK